MLITFRHRLLAVSRSLSLTIAGALLATNVLIILYGVLTRYLLGGAPIWTDELSRFLIIATVMLAAGAVWAEGGHMRVALLERRLPGRLAAALVVYQWLVTLAIALGGAFVSYRYAMSPSIGLFKTSGLGISRSIPLLSLAIGFALLAVHVLLYGPAPLKTVEDDQ
ncbi:MULTISPECIES: TRAP transporter small permease [unclassified Halomonas]|uniref:TRAP transporter small permease n=1 Tax=unclassified Halomonas TaxID=2609666 RepID=UPI00209FE643|nr:MULTISPECIES: TRAP transporter small permease [unclassified Halomonas]MCP1314414.1 TRAP transporter small permease [Halomonas sp. 707D7]MCP1327000.1 TRAP transporter small permease [Halomonas sp. 707D4]